MMINWSHCQWKFCFHARPVRLINGLSAQAQPVPLIRFLSLPLLETKLVHSDAIIPCASPRFFSSPRSSHHHHHQLDSLASTSSLSCTHLVCQTSDWHTPLRYVRPSYVSLLHRVVSRHHTSLVTYNHAYHTVCYPPRKNLPFILHNSLVGMRPFIHSVQASTQISTISLLWTHT